MTSPVSKCHIIPPDELRCVWMSAGILSYRLCDRHLDCDHCPLDAAVRKRSPRNEVLPELESRIQENQGARFYSRNHCWAKEIHENLVRVGIEPRLGTSLVALKAVVLPAEGQQVNRGQTCLWIVMEGGTLPLESPLTGTIRDTNSQLAEKPHLLRMQPLDHGWLYDIEVREAANRSGLTTLEQAYPKYARDEARFAALLANALEHGRTSAGVTLADGGQQLQSLADMLGPNKYFALLRKVFSAG